MAFNLTAQLNIALNSASLRAASNQLNTALNSNTQVKLGIDRNSSSGLKQIKSQIDESTNAMEAFGKQSGLAAKRFAAFSVTAGAFIAFTAAAKEAVSAAIDFDFQMVKLGQVSSSSGNEIKNVASEITRLATNYGVSSKELGTVAITLKQANLSLADTKIALESLAQAALAPNFENLKDTTEGAIAIMNQFKIEAKDLGVALGSVNAVAGEFAVEAGDIIEAIRKTGGAFKAAGGNLNELIALFTSVRQTTRESAESISTGLRTIFTRIQRNDTVEALRAVNIQLRYTSDEARALGDAKLENQFVGPYEAVKRLAAGLKGLQSTDPRFSAIVEQLGGYRQISKVIPLINEFAIAQKALGVAQAGSTSLSINAGQAQDALIIKFQKLKETFLEVGRNIVNSPGFRGLVDTFISASSSVLGLIDSLKGLLPLITALAAVKLFQGAASFTKGFLSSGSDKKDKKAEGGFLRMRTGGIVPGSGSGDKVRALLEPGELVVPRNQVARQKFAQDGEDGSAGKVKKIKMLPFKQIKDSAKNEFTHLDLGFAPRRDTEASTKYGKGYSNFAIDLPKSWNRDWGKSPNNKYVNKDALAKEIENGDIFKTYASTSKENRNVSKYKLKADLRLNFGNENYKTFLDNEKAIVADIVKNSKVKPYEDGTALPYNVKHDNDIVGFDTDPQVASVLAPAIRNLFSNFQNKINYDESQKEKAGEKPRYVDYSTIGNEPISAKEVKSIDPITNVKTFKGRGPVISRLAGEFDRIYALGGSVNRQRFMEGKYVGPKPLHPDLSAQEILGMAKGYKPNEQEVKKGFGRASLIHHPDRGGSNYNMGRVNSSYNYLKGGSITDWEKSVRAAKTSYVDELRGRGEDKEAADFESTIPVRGKNKAKSQEPTNTTGPTPKAEPKQDPNLNNYADESFAQMNARTGNSSSKARREWQFATPDAFTTPNRFDSFEAVRNADQFREKEEKSKTINASSAYSDRLKAAKAKRGYAFGGNVGRQRFAEGDSATAKPQSLEQFYATLNPKQLEELQKKIAEAKAIIARERESEKRKLENDPLKAVSFNFAGKKFRVVADDERAAKEKRLAKPKYDLSGTKSLDELLSKLPPKNSEELRAKIGRAQDKFLQTKDAKALTFAYDFGDRRGPLNIQLEKDVIKFGSIASFPWKPKTRKEKRTEELRIATERNARNKAQNIDKSRQKSETASGLSSLISSIDEENQQNKFYGIARDTKVFEGSDQYKELQKKLAAAREKRRMDETQSLVGSTDYKMGDISKGLSPSVYNLGYENKNLARLRIEDRLNQVKQDELVNPKEQFSLDNELQNKIFQRSQLRRSERSQVENPIGINEDYDSRLQYANLIQPKPFGSVSSLELTKPEIGIARSQKTKKGPRVKKTEGEKYNIARKQSSPAQEKTLFDEMELAKIGTYRTQEERIKNDADKAKRFRDAASESARVKFNLNPRQQRRAIANENLADNLMSLRSKGTGKPVVSQAQAAAPIPTPAPIVSNADTENVILKALAGKQSDFWKTIRQTTTDNNAVTKALQSLQAQGKIVSDSNKIGFYLLAEKNKVAKTRKTKPVVSEPITTTSTRAPSPQIPEDSYNPYGKPKKPRAKKNTASSAQQSNFYNTQESEYQKLLDSINAQSRSKKGRRFASGGLVPGTGNSDTVPMDLPENSFVIRKSSVNKIGAANLAKQARFASGGTVPALVTPGEYIYTPEEAKKIGSSKLHRMNKYAKFASGGFTNLVGADFDPNDPDDIKKLKETLQLQIRQGSPQKSDAIVDAEVQDILDDIQRDTANFRAANTARVGTQADLDQSRGLEDIARRGLGRSQQRLNTTNANVNRGQGIVDRLTQERDTSTNEANRQAGIFTSSRADVTTNLANAATSTAQANAERQKTAVLSQNTANKQADVDNLVTNRVAATDPRMVKANLALIAAREKETRSAEKAAAADTAAANFTAQARAAHTRAANAATAHAAATNEANRTTVILNNAQTILSAVTATQQADMANLSINTQRLARAEGRTALATQANQAAIVASKTAADKLAELQVDDNGNIVSGVKKDAEGNVTDKGKVIGSNGPISGDGSIESILLDKEARFKSTTKRSAGRNEIEALKSEAVNQFRQAAEKQVRSRAEQEGKPISDLNVQTVVDQYTREFSEGKRRGNVNKEGEVTGDKSLGRELTASGNYKEDGQFTKMGAFKDFASRAFFGAKRTDFETGTEGNKQFRQSQGQTVANKLIGGAALAGFVSDRMSKSAGKPEDFITPNGGGPSEPPDPSKVEAYKATMAFAGALTKGTTYAAAAGQALAQYGPLVAGIGAGVAGLVGAIQGYADALEEAEKAIREQKIAVGLKNLEDIYASVASGLVEVNDATIRNIQSNQADVQKNKSEQLLADAGGNTSGFSSFLNTVSFGQLGKEGFDSKKYVSSVAKSEKEDNARSVSQSTMVLNKLSSTIGKDSAKELKASGKDITATSFEDQKPELLKKLRDENSGFGKAEIRKIASTQQISIPDAEKQFLAAMKDAFESEKAKAVSLKQIETNNRTIASMALLSGAVNAAAAAADNFNERLSLNNDLFEGNTGSTKITSQADRIGMSGSNPNFSQFNSAISESSGLLGDYGQSFKAQGNAVNVASQILPEILANSAANPVSGKDPSAQIVDALRAGLKERGITGAEADKVVNSVGGKVSAEEFTKQLAEAGGDVGKATEKLLSDIKDPLVAAFKDIDAKLTEQSQAYISGLENLAKRQNQILQEFDKLAGLKSQQSSFRASEAQRSPNARYGAEESRALDVARNAQAERQMRLTGLGRGGSQDSGVIAARLKEAEKKAEKQSLALDSTPKDKQSGSAFRDAALELTKTKNEAANLKTALKNLTDQSGLLEAAQKKLASVRSGVDEKRSFGRKLLTQTPEDQDKMLRGQQIFNQVKARGGSLQGMSTEENAVLFDFLDNFGSAGKKIQEQILDANGYGASQDDLSEEKALVALHDRLYQEQINAQQLYIVSQQGLQNEYFTKLEDKNKTFYRNLEKFTQELTKNEKSVERNKEQQKLAKIEDVQKNAKPLVDAGFKTQTDFDLLSQNKTKVEDLANTKRQIQTLKDAGSAKITTEVEKNKQGNISNLSDIKVELQNAGYNEDQINQISQKIADGSNLKSARLSVGTTSRERLETKEEKQKNALKGNQNLIDLSESIANDKISSETITRALDNVKELGLGTNELGTSAETARANIKRLQLEINNLGGTQVGIQQNPQPTPPKPVGIALADGGSVFTPRGTDTVPAMLTPGEFVVNRNATQQNLPLLRSINSGSTSYLSGGGQVGYYADAGPVALNTPLAQAKFEDSEENKKFKQARIEHLNRIEKAGEDVNQRSNTYYDYVHDVDYKNKKDDRSGFFPNFFGKLPLDTLNNGIKNNSAYIEKNLYQKDGNFNNNSKTYSDNIKVKIGRSLKNGTNLNNSFGYNDKDFSQLINEDISSYNTGLTDYENIKKYLKDKFSSANQVTQANPSSSTYVTEKDFDAYWMDTELKNKDKGVENSFKDYRATIEGFKKQSEKIDNTSDYEKEKKTYEDQINAAKAKIIKDKVMGGINTASQVGNSIISYVQEQKLKKSEGFNTITGRQGILQKSTDIDRQKKAYGGEDFKKNYIENAFYRKDIGNENLENNIGRFKKEDELYQGRRGSAADMAKIFLQRQAQAQIIVGTLGSPEKPKIPAYLESFEAFKKYKDEDEKGMMSQDSWYNPRTTAEQRKAYYERQKSKYIEDNPYVELSPVQRFDLGQKELDKVIYGQQSSIAKDKLTGINSNQKSLVSSYLKLNSFDKASKLKGKDLVNLTDKYKSLVSEVGYETTDASGKPIKGKKIEFTGSIDEIYKEQIKKRGQAKDIGGDEDFIKASVDGEVNLLKLLGPNVFDNNFKKLILKNKDKNVLDTAAGIEQKMVGSFVKFGKGKFNSDTKLFDGQFGKMPASLDISGALFESVIPPNLFNADLTGLPLTAEDRMLNASQILQKNANGLKGRKTLSRFGNLSFDYTATEASEKLVDAIQKDGGLFRIMSAKNKDGNWDRSAEEILVENSSTQERFSKLIQKARGNAAPADAFGANAAAPVGGGVLGTNVPVIPGIPKIFTAAAAVAQKVGSKATQPNPKIATKPNNQIVKLANDQFENDTADILKNFKELKDTAYREKAKQVITQEDSDKIVSTDQKSFSKKESAYNNGLLSSSFEYSVREPNSQETNITNAKLDNDFSSDPYTEKLNRYPELLAKIANFNKFGKQERGSSQYVRSVANLKSDAQLYSVSIAASVKSAKRMEDYYDSLIKQNNLLLEPPVAPIPVGFDPTKFATPNSQIPKTTSPELPLDLGVDRVDPTPEQIAAAKQEMDDAYASLVQDKLDNPNYRNDQLPAFDRSNQASSAYYDLVNPPMTLPNGGLERVQPFSYDYSNKPKPEEGRREKQERISTKTPEQISNEEIMNRPFTTGPRSGDPVLDFNQNGIRIKGNEQQEQQYSTVQNYLNSPTYRAIKIYQDSLDKIKLKQSFDSSPEGVYETGVNGELGDTLYLRALDNVIAQLKPQDVITEEYKKYTQLFREQIGQRLLNPTQQFVSGGAQFATKPEVSENKDDSLKGLPDGTYPAKPGSVGTPEASKNLEAMINAGQSDVGKKPKISSNQQYIDALYDEVKNAERALSAKEDPADVLDYELDYYDIDEDKKAFYEKNQYNSEAQDKYRNENDGKSKAITANESFIEITNRRNNALLSKNPKEASVYLEAKKKRDEFDKKIMDYIQKYDIKTGGNFSIDSLPPLYKATGGNVPSYRSNPNPSYFKARGTDTVPAMLTPGEFVVNAAATAQHGDLLNSINSGRGVGNFALGGKVSYLEDGGKVKEARNAFHQIISEGDDDRKVIILRSSFEKIYSEGDDNPDLIDAKKRFATVYNEQPRDSRWEERKNRAFNRLEIEKKYARKPNWEERKNKAFEALEQAKNVARKPDWEARKNKAFEALEQAKKEESTAKPVVSEPTPTATVPIPTNSMPTAKPVVSEPETKPVVSVEPTQIKPEATAMPVAKPTYNTITGDTKPVVSELETKPATEVKPEASANPIAKPSTPTAPISTKPNKNNNSTIKKDEISEGYLEYIMNILTETRNKNDNAKINLETKKDKEEIKNQSPETLSGIKPIKTKGIKGLEDIKFDEITNPVKDFSNMSKSGSIRLEEFIQKIAPNKFTFKKNNFSDIKNDGPKIPINTKDQKYTPYSIGRPSIENDDLSPSGLIFSKQNIPKSIDPKFDLTKSIRVPFSDYNKPKTTSSMEERNKFLEAYNELRMFQNYEENDSDIKSNEDKYIYPGMGDIYRSINEQNKKRQDRYSDSLEKPTDDGYPETIYPPIISDLSGSDIEAANEKEYNLYPKVFGDLNKQIIELKRGRRRVSADDRIAYLEQAKNKSSTQEEELRTSKTLQKYIDFRRKIGKDAWTEDRDGKVITDTDLFLEKFNIQDAYNTLIRNRSIKNSPSFDNEPIMGMNEEKETQTLIEATAAILKENERLGIYVRSSIESGKDGKAVEVKGGELRKRGYEKDDAYIKGISIFGKQMKKDEEGRTGSKTGGLLTGADADNAKAQANMWARSNNPKLTNSQLPYPMEEYGSGRSGELTQEAKNKKVYYNSTPYARNVDVSKPEGTNTRPVEVAKVAPKEPSKEEQEAKAKEQGFNQLRGLTQRDFSELNMSARDYYVALTSRSPISEQDRNELLANQATNLDFPAENDEKGNTYIDRKKLSVLTGKSNPLRIFEKELNNDINDNEKRRWERVQQKASIYYSEYESLNRSLALVFDKAANASFSEPLFAQTDNQAKQLVAFLQKDTARNTAGPTFFSNGGNVPSYRPNPNPSYFKPKGTDTVPAMLSPGEFVINAGATAKHSGLLSAINSGQDVGYSATGGMIYLQGGSDIPNVAPRQPQANKNSPEYIAELQEKYRKVVGKEYKGNAEELFLWNESIFGDKILNSSFLQETQGIPYPSDTPYFKANKDAPRQANESLHQKQIEEYNSIVKNSPRMNLGTPIATALMSHLDALKQSYPGLSTEEIYKLTSEATKNQEKSRKNPSNAMKIWDRYSQHMINYKNLNITRPVTVTDNKSTKDNPIGTAVAFATVKSKRLYVKNNKSGQEAIGHEMGHSFQDPTTYPLNEGQRSVIKNQKKYGIESSDSYILDPAETGTWVGDMKRAYYRNTGDIWNGSVIDLIKWGKENDGAEGADRFQSVIDNLKITHEKDPESPSPESFIEYLEEVKNNVVKGGNTAKDVRYSATGGPVSYLKLGTRKQFQDKAGFNPKDLKPLGPDATGEEIAASINTFRKLQVANENERLDNEANQLDNKLIGKRGTNKSLYALSGKGMERVGQDNRFDDALKAADEAGLGRAGATGGPDVTYTKPENTENQKNQQKQIRMPLAPPKNEKRFLNKGDDKKGTISPCYGCVETQTNNTIDTFSDEQSCLSVIPSYNEGCGKPIVQGGGGGAGGGAGMAQPPSPGEQIRQEEESRLLDEARKLIFGELEVFSKGGMPKSPAKKLAKGGSVGYYSCGKNGGCGSTKTCSSCESGGPSLFNDGGLSLAPSDTIPAMLTPGEFVVNAKSSAKNASLLHDINSGKDVEGFATGGSVGYYAGGKSSGGSRASDRLSSAASKLSEAASKLSDAASKISPSQTNVNPIVNSRDPSSFVEIKGSSFDKLTQVLNSGFRLEELSSVLKTEIRINQSDIGALLGAMNTFGNSVGSFSTAVDKFSSSAITFNSEFVTALTNFDTYITNLKAAAALIPTQIDVKGNINTNVSVGMDATTIQFAVQQVVQDVSDEMKRMINDAINRAENGI